MSNTPGEVPVTTVFEDIWRQPTGQIFRSERHGMMAFADKFPRMPLQVIIAPARGTPGSEAHIFDLEENEQRKLLELSRVVGTKILEHCAPSQRSMYTLEGFAVPDHPHIVNYAGQRRQGINRYSGPALGDWAVQNTLELIQFTPVEAEQIEANLSRIDQV